MIERRKRIVLYSPQLADESRGLPSGKDVLPLSILTVAGWPVADGYEVILIDGCLYSQEEAHRRVLEACEGAFVYGTTGILGYQVADGFLCSQKVRAKFPDLKMIIGGWFASAAPELQLETGLYDAVCIGQGEITFREFVQAADCGEPFDDIPGLALWRDGKMVKTEPRRIVGWDHLKNCPWDLIDFDRYREEQLKQRSTRLTERLPRPKRVPAPKPYVGIAYYASFGCPEPCTFCCSPGMTNMRWKCMPADRMLDDLEELNDRWDFDVVRFHDANWGVMEKRSRAFAEGLLNSKMRFEWFPFLQSFSILRYKPDTLDMMTESGLYVAAVGAEAGTDEMMQLIGKHTKGEDNYYAALELDKRGVTSWMTYIIGYPGETVESMLGSIDQARRIVGATKHAQPAVWPFHPIPGSKMYDDALEMGFEPPTSLVGWGEFFEYHLAQTWKAGIPPEVVRQRQLFQHYASLSHGLARGKVGWWEKRARRRMASGDFTLARAEAKAFDLYHRFSRALRPDKPPAQVAWESGDGLPATSGGSRS